MAENFKQARKHILRQSIENASNQKKTLLIKDKNLNLDLQINGQQLVSKPE